MSGRTRVTLADGRRVTGFRKTLARREHVPPHLRPDTRMMILLPPVLALVSPGPTAVCGVSIEPGPMAVAAGKLPEWVYRQMATWLLSAARGMEMILTAVLERGEQRREQQVVVQPGTVEYPRGAKAPLRFST
jgi:hypothetical protein